MLSPVASAAPTTYFAELEPNTLLVRQVQYTQSPSHLPFTYLSFPFPFPKVGHFLISLS